MEWNAASLPSSSLCFFFLKTSIPRRYFQSYSTLYSTHHYPDIRSHPCPVLLPNFFPKDIDLALVLPLLAVQRWYNHDAKGLATLKKKNRTSWDVKPELSCIKAAERPWNFNAPLHLKMFFAFLTFLHIWMSLNCNGKQTCSARHNSEADKIQMHSLMRLHDSKSQQASIDGWYKKMKTYG